MTLEEWKVRFTAWQLQNKAQWIIDEGKLRMWFPPEYFRCPITAEFNCPSSDYGECAAALELDYHAENAIIEASDGDVKHDPELRAWLLKICGVKEVVG